MNFRYEEYLDKFYDDIRKMESNYPDYKITALVKKANRSKQTFDRHKLYMLLRKLNPKNFDDHINEDKFLTLRLCQPSLWSSNKILISFFIMHWLRQAISQNLNADVLNLAKTKDSKIFTNKYIKDLDPETKL